MALCHTEVRLPLSNNVLLALMFQGYSHPGLEKVYSKAEIGSRDVIETDGDSLRQVQDFKVSAHESVGGF